MPTVIRCAGCGSMFSVSDALLGKKVRCNSCTRVIVVGAQDEEPVALEVHRPTRRRRPREDDEDDVPIRRRRSRDKQPAMLALIVGGIAAGVLLFGLAFVGVWWLVTRANPANATDTAPASPAFLGANSTPQTQGHRPPGFAGNGMPQNRSPAPGAMPNQPPANDNGGTQTVQLSNARVSGFGAHIQIEVDFRFNAGAAGSDLYLMVKPTHLGLHQTLYEVHLRHALGKSHGTVVASGMTFGIESGPFEVWMEQGGPSGFIRGLGGPQRRTISNVLRVETKEFSLPGPLQPPGMPRVPRPGFPFGPRH